MGAEESVRAGIRRGATKCHLLRHIVIKAQTSWGWLQDLYKNGPVDSQVLDKGGARSLNFWL